MARPRRCRGVASSTTSSCAAPVGRRRARHRGHPGDVLDRGTTSSAPPGEHDRGVGAPAGKDSASRRPAEIASGFSRNCSASVEPVSTCSSPSDSPASTHAQAAMAARAPATRRRPGATATRCRPAPAGRRAAPAARTPSDRRAPARTGSTTSTTAAATTTPIAQATPRPRVVGNDREQQRQQADHHGRRARQHRLGGAASAAHRDVPVLVRRSSSR